MRFFAEEADVENQPVEPELTRGLDKLVEIDGLADVAIGAQAVASNAVFLLVGRGEDHHRQQIGARIGAQARRTSKPSILGNLRSSKITWGMMRRSRPE